MDIIEDSKFRNAYKIVNNHGNFELCKLLNEYDNEKEANADLMKLLTHKATEKDILKDYSAKKVF